METEEQLEARRLAAVMWINYEAASARAPSYHRIISKEDFEIACSAAFLDGVKYVGSDKVDLAKEKDLQKLAVKMAEGDWYSHPTRTGLPGKELYVRIYVKAYIMGYLLGVEEIAAAKATERVEEVKPIS